MARKRPAVSGSRSPEHCAAPPTNCPYKHLAVEPSPPPPPHPRFYGPLIARGIITSILMAIQTSVIAGDHGLAAATVAFSLTLIVFGNWRTAHRTAHLPFAALVYAVAASLGTWLGTDMGRLLRAVFIP